MHTRLSFLFALFLTACIGPLDPDNSEYIEIREVTVGPALARCYGVGEQTCMIVDGLLFYDGIEGFNYELRKRLTQILAMQNKPDHNRCANQGRHRIQRQNKLTTRQMGDQIG